MRLTRTTTQVLAAAFSCAKLSLHHPEFLVGHMAVDSL